LGFPTRPDSSDASVGVGVGVGVGEALVLEVLGLGLELAVFGCAPEEQAASTSAADRAAARERGFTEAR
jgi:hypothetical protein